MILTNYANYKLFYAATTLSETEFDYYANVCSSIIEEYLNRNLGVQTNTEYHWTDESNTIMLDEYPVNDIYLASQGLGYYGNLTLSNIYKPIQINNDKTSINIIYDLGATKNSFALADYATITLLMDALKTDIEAETVATSGSVDVSISPDYVSVSPIYLSQINYTNAAKSGIFEMYGYDLNNQLSYTLEANRVMHFNRRLVDGSNAIMVIYNSGYANIAALPTVLVDICDRMIRDLELADDNYINMLYQKEKLGNAEVTNWDWADLKNNIVSTGIVLKYKTILDKFKKIDCAFY